MGARRAGGLGHPPGREPWSRLRACLRQFRFGFERFEKALKVGFTDVIDLKGSWSAEQALLPGLIVWTDHAADWQ
jgi:hypothetical protein